MSSAFVPVVCVAVYGFICIAGSALTVMRVSVAYNIVIRAFIMQMLMGHDQHTSHIINCHRFCGGSISIHNLRSLRHMPQSVNMTDFVSKRARQFRDIRRSRDILIFSVNVPESSFRKQKNAIFPAGPTRKASS